MAVEPPREHTIPPACSIDCTYQPAHDDFLALFAELDAATAPVLGPATAQTLAILLRNAEGAAIGGVWARFIYRWCLIELLVIPPTLRGRGLGRDLIERLQIQAIAQNCIGMQVNSFDFQAPGFYRRLGFVEFGTLHDLPPGHSTVWLAKRLLP